MDMFVGGVQQGQPSTHSDWEYCHPTEEWDNAEQTVFLLVAVTFVLCLQSTLQVEPQDNCLLPSSLSMGLSLREAQRHPGFPSR